MALVDAVKNQMLDTLRGQNPTLFATHMSLHTADPGTTGADEVVGGSYARQAITWNAAAAGVLDDVSVPDFDVPGGTTITHFGLWTAVSAGTFVGGDELSASETFGSASTYTVSNLTVSL